MATYSVYDNILIKLESVFLKVEMEVDREITQLLTEHNKLVSQLTDLKNKVEVLNSIKRSGELYFDNEVELNNLKRALFKILSDKQILLRFLQEKELLLNGYLIPLPEMKLPSIVELNKEYKLRKKLQEIELLSSFLIDHPSFERFLPELEKATEIFDLAIESGASDKFEETVNIFQNYFEKMLNIYDLEEDFLEQFKDFRSQILLQANQLTPFTPPHVESLYMLQEVYKSVQIERLAVEHEVNKLLYQFTMLQNGKKIIQAEIKNMNGELESVLFKEYAVKQKIQELRQYKSELNSQKDNFLKDPTVDGYTQAVKQLESVEQRFRRLIMHRSFDKQAVASRFFSGTTSKSDRSYISEEQSAYSKMLFQALHNYHISSEDKATILRLSKPSKLINSNSGKFFYQRTAKTRSLKSIENTFKKYQINEVH